MVWVEAICRLYLHHEHVFWVDADGYLASVVFGSSCIIHNGKNHVRPHSESQYATQRRNEH
jgi:hypothetical protein